MATAIKTKLAAIPCTPTDISVSLTAEQLEPFVAPILDAEGRRLCVKCAKRMLIRWGLQNGEANCVDCGYPCRFYHRAPDSPTVEFCLQYKPEYVKRVRR